MKFVSLLSSGIDSPVATYLLSKKADEIVFVHADNRPLTDDREIDNFLNLAMFLKKKLKCDVKVYLVPHGNSLLEFRNKFKITQYSIYAGCKNCSLEIIS